MKVIEPISPLQQQQVIAETERYISIASDFFQHPIASIPIIFNLKGRAAGMYKVDRGRRLLRFNPYLFAKYFQDNLLDTVPHEVAHYVSDVVYGLRHIRPHGKEWQSIMHVFGATPKRTHNFDMRGIPTRQHQRFHYQCQCQVYQLTARRHNMIQKGQRRYLCRYCHSELNLKTNCGQPAG